MVDATIYITVEDMAQEDLDELYHQLSMKVGAYGATIDMKKEVREGR